MIYLLIKQQVINICLSLGVISHCLNTPRKTKSIISYQCGENSSAQNCNFWLLFSGKLAQIGSRSKRQNKRAEMKNFNILSGSHPPFPPTP